MGTAPDNAMAMGMTIPYEGILRTDHTLTLKAGKILDDRKHNGYEKLYGEKTASKPMAITTETALRKTEYKSRPVLENRRPWQLSL